MNPLEGDKEEEEDGDGGMELTPHMKKNHSISTSSSTSSKGNVGSRKSSNVPVPTPKKVNKTNTSSSSCNSPQNMAAWERKRKSFRQYYRSLQRRSSSSTKAGVEQEEKDSGEGAEGSYGSSSTARRYSESERSLTDDDFDEVKGFIDLGFGFDLDQMPHLSNVLPALSVCYAVNQSIASGSSSPSPSRLSDSPSLSSSCSLPPSPRPSWTVSCTGDSPEEVKVRLRQWAQAVGCNLRQASPRR